MRTSIQGQLPQRILDRLVAEHEADDVSYPMVRAYVRCSCRRRRVAEVDFGDVYIVPAGVPTKV
ncbi:hypothetical protein [Actinacidiphila paucisporea]|uniref:hypothetical protein n=1 Tax=Actinacidiphila paucisporea TaxID=310782 RepID=UPI0011614D0A|nr:hypothetical protein [Actinacidiphila paucisporea]